MAPGALIATIYTDENFSLPLAIGVKIKRSTSRAKCYALQEDGQIRVRYASVRHVLEFRFARILWQAMEIFLVVSTNM